MLTCLLTAVTTGCGSESGSESANNDPSVNPENVVNVIANTKGIIELTVGEAALLDGSKSSTSNGEVLTYSWSFTSRPAASSAVLQNTTSATPGFTADASGTYKVQLVVSAGEASSQRAIATVLAFEAGGRPLYYHHGYPSTCSNCHDGETYQKNGELVVPKSPDHLATSNICEACHTNIATFALIPFVDHEEVFGVCSSCHNGVLAIGKSAWHIATTVECNECHSTTGFLELGEDGSFDHSDIARACGTCHNGITATGKTENHPETNSECNLCHSTKTFTGAGYDHTGIVDDCASCHDGAGPGLSIIGKTSGHPDIPDTSVDCHVCHNTVTFVLANVFNHRVIDSITQPCESCHNGDHVAAGARGKTTVQSGHPDTITDCGACHNTKNFLDYYVDHTSSDVTSVRCDSCHGVGSIIGKPSPNHVDTSEDCNTCHTPGNFATGIFDHTAVAADTGIRCDSCHNEVITVGKIGNHLPTAEDCRVCHTTDTFAGATVDHTGIVDGCVTCHNGTITTGKPARTHVPSNDDCNICHVTSDFKPASVFAHQSQAIAQGCEACHNGAFTYSPTTNTTATIPGKPGTTHIPTQADCDVCHSSTDSFLGATFDHTGTTRGCEGCHNGRFTTATITVSGKAGNHIPTSQDCHLCHTTTAFSPNTFAHTGISSNCVSCHDGNRDATGAIGAPNDALHNNTSADCVACHSTANYLNTGKPRFQGNAFVNHSSSAVTGTECKSCHNGSTATGMGTGHVAITPSQDCGLCHVAGGTFIPAVFDHSTVSRNTRCDSCHNNTNAVGKAAKTNPDHVQTTQDCRVCHNTDAFAGATFNHQGITGNCVSCHNGVTATGKHNNHVPTNGDCIECHQTTGFKPATFAHVGIVDNCASCHNGVLATGKTPNHTVTNLDCGVCHTTKTFLGASFGHVGIVDNCARSGCHGSGATGKNTGHLDTALDCSNCHTTATFAGGTWVHDSSTAGNCKTCHSPGNGATSQPQNHFNTTAQCDVCHTTNGWAPTSKFKHTTNDYPGDHNRNVGCVNCHTTNDEVISSFRSSPYHPDCAACHSGDFRRKGDHIGGSNGTVAQNKNCGASGCHRVSGNGF